MTPWDKKNKDYSLNGKPFFGGRIKVHIENVADRF